MEPTFRDRVGVFLRQLSTGHEKKCSRNPCTSPTSSGSFIHKYLLGEVQRYHPKIHYAKSCYDLPNLELATLKKTVLAAYTGPAGGLTSVDSNEKPFDSPDANLHFIDDDNQETFENLIPKDLVPENKEPDDEDKGSSHKPSESKPLIAGIENWSNPCDAAYGVATTLYECHPVTKQNAGNPIADAFAVVMRENNALLVLADGVNWGEKSCLAARCAVHGCIDYLNKSLYREGSRNDNTLDIFIALLRSFREAHNLIIREEGTLTTLCAAVETQLRNSNKFVACTCNVGDSLAYVYSPKYGVREITQGSHDIYSMRNMRDALGALGPVDGVNPELSNLTVAMTELEVGDIVFLASDGITDNFDPVVGKFAIPRKVKKSARTCSEKAFDPVHGHDATSKHQNEEEEFIPDFRLPVVEAHQRHELTLLRMEDLIVNGVNEGDTPCQTARQICEQMIDFAEKLTIAKRRILEDPDLYQNEDLEISQGSQKSRRRKVAMVVEKLAMVPGKLDHASVVAYMVGEQLQSCTPVIDQSEQISGVKN